MLVPEGKRAKNQLVLIKDEPARKPQFCKLCRERYAPGDRVVMVKWAADDDAFGIAHGACYDALPDELTPAASNGAGTLFEQIRWRKLEDGERHRGERYGVFVGDQRVYSTGQEQRAIGVAEYLGQQA